MLPVAGDLGLGALELPPSSGLLGRGLPAGTGVLLLPVGGPPLASPLDGLQLLQHKLHGSGVDIGRCSQCLVGDGLGDPQLVINKGRRGLHGVGCYLVTRWSRAGDTGSGLRGRSSRTRLMPSVTVGVRMVSHRVYWSTTLVVVDVVDRAGSCRFCQA